MEVFQPSKYLEYIAFKFILINEGQTSQAVLLPKPMHRAELFEKMRSHSRLTLTEEVKQQNHHQTCSASSAEFLHSMLLSTCSRRMETESTTTPTHHTVERRRFSSSGPLKTLPICRLNDRHKRRFCILRPLFGRFCRNFQNIYNQDD